MIMKELYIKGIDSAVSLAKILLENGHRVIIQAEEQLGEEEYVFFRDHIYHIMYTEIDDLE